MAITKNFSFGQEDMDLYDWISKQAHQSELMRRGLKLVKFEKEHGVDLLKENKERQRKETERTVKMLAEVVDQSVRNAIQSLRIRGIDIPSDIEDEAAASALLGARRDE